MARGSVSVHVWLCSLAVCVGVTVLTRVLRLRAGFTVGGAVLDRKTLRTLGITLGGGITTLITALLTLADTERGGKYDDEVARSCTLSTMQKEVNPHCPREFDMRIQLVRGFQRKLGELLGVTQFNTLISTTLDTDISDKFPSPY